MLCKHHFSKNGQVFFHIFWVVTLIMQSRGIFIWAFISLVHLLSVTIMAFLPETRIRLVQWIIYLVVIIVASFIFDQVQRLFLLPFGGYDSNTLTGSSSVLVGIGIFIVTILLISAVNVYLLEKWVETK